ncbi:MAG: hypothetical protein KAH54_06290 [Candidatus Sabulitectum sp.]|nr:hypothetical protein [Candidatus Sabulitectum sp.]
MAVINCVLCGEQWHGETMPFGAVCEKCDCWLHSCIQCALWDPSARMCRSMTTDPVADPQGKNFCEEWKPGKKRERINSEKDHSKSFDSLFGD